MFHDFLWCIHQKHETLTTKSLIKVYINRINNRLVFKIKDGYEIELQTRRKMKLFGSTKKLIHKTKCWKKVLSLDEVEVVLVQCNLIDNQYQGKPEVLYTFTGNSFYGYLWNVEPSNLVFLENHNTEFDEINSIYWSKW